MFIKSMPERNFGIENFHIENIVYEQSSNNIKRPKIANLNYNNQKYLLSISDGTQFPLEAVTSFAQACGINNMQVINVRNSWRIEDLNILRNALKNLKGFLNPVVIPVVKSGQSGGHTIYLTAHLENGNYKISVINQSYLQNNQEEQNDLLALANQFGQVLQDETKIAYNNKIDLKLGAFNSTSNTAYCTEIGLPFIAEMANKNIDGFKNLLDSCVNEKISDEVIIKTRLLGAIAIGRVNKSGIDATFNNLVQNNIISEQDFRNIKLQTVFGKKVQDKNGIDGNTLRDLSASVLIYPSINPAKEIDEFCKQNNIKYEIINNNKESKEPEETIIKSNYNEQNNINANKKKELSPARLITVLLLNLAFIATVLTLVLTGTLPVLPVVLPAVALLLAELPISNLINNSVNKRSNHKNVISLDFLYSEKRKLVQKSKPLHKQK